MSTDLGPHARESAMALDDQANVRVYVVASFPIVLALLWPSVRDGLHGLFLACVAIIFALNGLGWALPWHRMPRWTETLPAQLTIVALWLITAIVGGTTTAFGMIMIVPLLWLAIFADAIEIASGFVLTAACVFAPVDHWIHQLPAQGSLRTDLVFLLLSATILVGVRPVVWQLRGQVTETRLAVHALRAAQSALAHDLRNPLAATYAVATLAAQRVEPDGVSPDPKLAEHLELLMQSTKRMEATIAGVLELSRAGERLEVVEHVDLAALVDDVARSIPDLQVEHTDLPTDVLGDSASLRRLLHSLFGVALHRSADQTPARDAERPARVALHGSELPDAWRITVRHDGLPMDARALASRLEPRRRSDDPDRDGDALQLSIVAAIVEQHGGEIEVDLDAVSPTISFTLARQPRHASTPVS